MYQIDDHTLDQVRKSADIVEVLGKYLKLKKNGHNYFTTCPFHQEKTPSFCVNPTQGLYHCFGCQASGNVINFVMEHNGLSFIDSVVFLANMYAVPLKMVDNKTKEQIVKEKQQHNNIVDVINKTVEFYQNNLTQSTLASKYLYNRGLSIDIVKRFMLGYTSQEHNALSKAFSDYKTNQFLLDAGLTLKSENGSIYDRFRDRIIFPIKNVHGEVVAFGGRVINKGEPKYLNSPQTTLFDKSHELYGLFEASKSIRSAKSAIVVEGYMDVLTMVQYGINNTVASMGTATTVEQITRLLRLCDDLYFCFDGDMAGKKAAWRALDRALPLIKDGKAIYFIMLPDKHDPDSFVRQYGSEHFINYQQKHAISLSSFLLQQVMSLVNIGTDEGKARLVHLVKPYLEAIVAPAFKVMLKKQLADLLTLPPGVLENILNNRSKTAFYSSKKDHAPQSTITKDPLASNVDVAIKHALLHIDWVIGYKIPENINSNNIYAQELVSVLDYINHHFDLKENNSSSEVNYLSIASALNLTKINIMSIMNYGDMPDITYDEFVDLLNRIFNVVKQKANKIPKIPTVSIVQ